MASYFGELNLGWSYPKTHYPLYTARYRICVLEDFPLKNPFELMGIWIHHFTKPLPKLLFYRHHDFYMGHVPPPYSPEYQECLRVYSVQDTKHKQYTAKAAKSLAPWDIIRSASPTTVVPYPFTTRYAVFRTPQIRG